MVSSCSFCEQKTQHLAKRCLPCGERSDRLEDAGHNPYPPEAPSCSICGSVMVWCGEQTFACVCCVNLLEIPLWQTLVRTGVRVDAG